MPQFFCNVRSKWSDEHYKLLKYLLIATLLLCKFAYCNHESRDRSVVRELLDVLGHLLDELMQCLHAVGCSLSISRRQELVGTIVVVEVPELLKEAEASVDTIGIPRLACLNWTKEHLVQTQGVGTILLYYHIRVDNIEHRLRHLLYCPTTYVLAI